MTIKIKSRLRFWKCGDFLDWRDQLSASVEIESRDRDKSVSLVIEWLLTEYKQYFYKKVP
jgi:hypothetical protein